MPRAARIILDKKEENAAGLLSELCRGKRQFRPTEKYTGEGRETFFCVFSKKEVHFGKRIIMNIDRNALFRLPDIREVLRNAVGDK